MSTPIPEQKSCFLHGDHDEDRCPRCARRSSTNQYPERKLMGKRVSKSKTKLRCGQCDRELYLDSEEKLRDLEENSVMCPNFDFIWHRAD